MSMRYPPERYSDDLILRVPPVLWLVMLFLVRHLILLGITFLPTRRWRCCAPWCGPGICPRT